MKVRSIAAAFGILSFSTLGLAAPIREIGLSGSRVHLEDLLGSAPEWKGIDLGPVPPPGGSRLIRKEELEAAIRESGKEKPKNLPEAVRVSRKTVAHDRLQLEAMVKESLARALPRGASVLRIRGESVRLPAGWTSIHAEVPKAPRRTGSWATTIQLVLDENGVELARLPIAVDFLLDKEAAVPDVARGSSILLVVKRGMVELECQALVTSDADIGDVVTVTVKSNGRALRAKMIDKGHADLVESP